MKKILFIQSEFDFNQFYDKDIFPNTDDVEYEGIKYLNKETEFFSKYSKIFSCDYSDGLAFSIIKKAKSINVDTYLLMDGIYDWANIHLNPKLKGEIISFDINSYNIVYCVDNHSASYLASIGANTFLYKPSRVFSLNLNKATKTNKILSSTKKKILLTTSNTPYFNEIEFNRIINIFKSIIEWSKANSVDIYFRIYNSEILSELNIADKFNLTEGSIETYIKKIDLLITTPSSISATAIMLDKPTVHIIYRDTPINFQTAWQIFNTEMIDETLKLALSRESKRMSHQRSIIPQVAINNINQEFNSNKKDSHNIKYSLFSLFLAIFKSKIKGLYYKIFKYK
tara:strand:- start:4071 stop:5093 length:1023 start_codon:yes stop_codon:yes gene_type:complete